MKLILIWALRKEGKPDLVNYVGNILEELNPEKHPASVSSIAIHMLNQ